MQTAMANGTVNSHSSKRAGLSLNSMTLMIGAVIIGALQRCSTSLQGSHRTYHYVANPHLKSKHALMYCFFSPALQCYKDTTD
eukprot:1161110-Pelagomonas_calceolata.AAC.4